MSSLDVMDKTPKPHHLSKVMSEYLQVVPAVALPYKVTSFINIADCLMYARYYYKMGEKIP